MRTMSLEAFKELLANGAWTHKQYIEFVDSTTWEHEPSEQDGNTGSYTLKHGYAEMKSCINDISIAYSTVITHTENVPNSLVTQPDDDDIPWDVCGLIVIDKGLVLKAHKIAEHLPLAFKAIDYSEISGHAELEAA